MADALFGHCRDAVAAECVAVSLDEFFEIVCRDPLDFMKAVHVAANGNEEFAATPWTPVPELCDGVFQSDISFRIPLAGLPVSLGDAVVNQQTQMMRTSSLIALRLVTRMPPALKGDCFEVVVVIRAQRTSDSHSCMVSVTGQVNFLASTWFQSLIESNAVKGYTAFYPFWLRELRRRVEAWRATHPTTPVAVPLSAPPTPTRSSVSDAASTGPSAPHRRRKAPGLLVLLERPKACESLIVRATSSGPLGRVITPSSPAHSMAGMFAALDDNDTRATLSLASSPVDTDQFVHRAPQTPIASVPSTPRSSVAMGGSAPVAMPSSSTASSSASTGSSWTSTLLGLLQPVTDAFKALGDVWSAPKLFSPQASIVQDIVSVATVPATAAIASLARVVEPTTAADAGAITKAPTSPSSQPTGKPSLLEILLTPRPAIVVAFAMSQVVMAVTYFVYKDAAWA